MVTAFRSRITGTGLGLPSRVITNDDLAKIIETNDEWIRTRTGIRERRAVDSSKGESGASISIQGAREALAQSGLKASQINAVICCTASPDTWIPITAARICGALDLSRSTFSFDLNAACSGFLSGMAVADGLLKTGSCDHVLVVGTDIFSSIIDPQDRVTSVLFGDGSGAAVLSKSPIKNSKLDPGIIEYSFFTDFDSGGFLCMPGGGSLHPPGSSDYSSSNHRPFLFMNGSEVFKAGSRGMVEAAKAVLQKAEISISEVDWFVPHQANKRIIEMATKLLDFPMEKTFMNLDRWGNTSAGTIPICLAEMSAQKIVKPGDLLLLDVFGAGYSYGAMLLRWG